MLITMTYTLDSLLQKFQDSHKIFANSTLDDLEGQVSAQTEDLLLTTGLGYDYWTDDLGPFCGLYTADEFKFLWTALIGD